MKHTLLYHPEFFGIALLIIVLFIFWRVRSNSKKEIQLGQRHGARLSYLPKPALINVENGLSSLMGKRVEITFFGKWLGRPHDNFYTLRKYTYNPRRIFMDFSDDYSFMELEIWGVTDITVKSNKVRIYAESFLLQWCFTSCSRWSRYGVSCWRMEINQLDSKRFSIDSFDYKPGNNQFNANKLETSDASITMHFI